MSPAEIISVRNYLCKRFGNEGITIKPRKVADSVEVYLNDEILGLLYVCLLYTSPSPRDQRGSRMPSSA